MNMSTRGLHHSVTTGRTMCNGTRRKDRKDHAAHTTQRPSGRAGTRPEGLVIVGPPVLGVARYLSWPPLPLSPLGAMDS